MKSFKYIEHTADVAIMASGDTLEEAFAAAAEAMFEIITDSSPIEPTRQIVVEAESDDMESLLVTFLSKMIVVFEIERMVLDSVEVKFDDSYRLTAIGTGEQFIEEKHGHGLHIKGVSYHMIEIFDGHGNGPSHVRVLFDV